MTFCVIHQPSPNKARSPVRLVERATGREIEWINRYLDYECLRRLSTATLRSYAYELLHFLRWWESVHHTEAVAEGEIVRTPLLLEYVRFQSSQKPECTGATINHRVAIVDKSLARCLS